MTPLDSTIRGVMVLTWPMIVICVLILSSIRLVDIFKNKKMFILHKEVLALIFLIYILCLFQIVTFTDLSIIGTNNFTPFKEIMRYQLGSRLFFKNVIGNLVMFVPFGIFASIYTNSKSKYQTFFLVLFASAVIESTQLIIGRVFDIDDIILNVTGGMIGYMIYFIIGKIGNKFPKFLKTELVLNIFSLIILFGLIGYVWMVVI